MSHSWFPFRRNYQYSVLMVCRANICRSPMAEGLFRHHLQRFGMDREIAADSAGTHASQPGKRPDTRAQEVCTENGVSIGKIKARQVVDADFDKYDLILAADAATQQWLSSFGSQPEKVELITKWHAQKSGRDIPDPYFGNVEGFVEIFRQLSVCTENLAGELKSKIGGP